MGIDHPFQGGLHHQPHDVIEFVGRPSLAGNLAC